LVLVEQADLLLGGEPGHEVADPLAGAEGGIAEGFGHGGSQSGRGGGPGQRGARAAAARSWVGVVPSGRRPSSTASRMRAAAPSAGASRPRVEATAMGDG